MSQTDRLVGTGSDEQQPAHRMGSLVIKVTRGAGQQKEVEFVSVLIVMVIVCKLISFYTLKNQNPAVGEVIIPFGRSKEIDST